jgi:hypothetical protein
MAGGKKSWETIFEFGGKVAGSFNAAVGSIQGKFSGLQKTAKNVTATIGKIGLAIGGAAVLAGIALVGRTLTGVFRNAEQAARRAMAREQEMTAILNSNAKIRARGPDAAKNDVAWLQQQSEQLDKIGILSDDHYMTMARTLALYGHAPAQIGKMLGPLGDVLVATKGVAAGEAEAQAMSEAVARSIQTGQLRAMRDYGVAIDEATQKKFRQMKPAQRLNHLMKELSRYEGAQLIAKETDLGAIAIYEKQLGAFSKNIGNLMIPMNAEFARLGSDILPALQPIVETVFGAFTNAMKGSTQWAREHVVPFFQDFGKTLQGGLGEALTGLSTAFGTVAAAASKFFGGVAEGGKSMGTIAAESVIAGINKLAEALSWAADHMDIIIPVVGSLVGTFVVLKTTLAALALGSLLVNPLGLIVVAVVAVVTAFQRWDQIKEIITNVWNSLKDMPVIGPMIQGLTDQISEFVADVQATWGKITQFFQSGFGAEAVAAVEAFMVKADALIKSGLAVIGAAFADFGAHFDAFFRAPIQGLKDTWSALGTFFSGTVGPLIEAGIQAAFAGVTQYFQTAYDSSTAVWTAIGGWFESNVSTPVINAVQNVGAALLAAFTQPIEQIKNAWSNLKNFIWNAIQNMIPGPIRGMLGLGGSAPDVGATQFGGIFGSPQVRSIAEAGSEAVIPINRTNRARGLLDRTAGAMGFSLVDAAAGMKGLGGDSRSFRGGPVSMSYAPQIVVNGPMDSAERTQLSGILSEHAQSFLAQLEAAQDQERRLAFE